MTKGKKKRYEDQSVAVSKNRIDFLKVKRGGKR